MQKQRPDDGKTSALGHGPTPNQPRRNGSVGKLVALAVLCALGQPLTTRADWTLPLPRRAGESRPTPASVNRYGALVFFYGESGGENAVAWYSQEGKLLLHYSWDNSKFRLGTETFAVLNSRQLVLYGDKSGSDAIRLLSLSPDGTHTVREYALTSSQRLWGFWGGKYETELSAF